MVGSKPDGADKKIIAGILGIVFGGLGVHKFVLGYSQEGGIMLGITLAGSILSICTFGLSFLAPLAIGTIGLVEGIIYLTKTDQEFVDTYIIGKKPWF